jgi:hypothetical protein
MNDLEKIQHIYFKQDNKPNVEKNRLMIAEIEKFQQRSKEEVFKNLFRSTSTFSIRVPKNFSSITETITTANKSMAWYRDNNYPVVARQIIEYGISFCQYSFSLPRPMTEFFQVFMEVNYPDYFKALGFNEDYYAPAENRFKREEIEDAVETINRKWKGKYKQLNFRTSKLQYDNLVNFNDSFTTELSELKLETP